MFCSNKLNALEKKKNINSSFNSPVQILLFSKWSFSSLVLFSESQDFLLGEVQNKLLASKEHRLITVLSDLGYFMC